MTEKGPMDQMNADWLEEKVIVMMNIHKEPDLQLHEISTWARMSTTKEICSQRSTPGKEFRQRQECKSIVMTNNHKMSSDQFESPQIQIRM
jgi:hypothetical protein